MIQCRVRQEVRFILDAVPKTRHECIVKWNEYHRRHLGRRPEIWLINTRLIVLGRGANHPRVMHNLKCAVVVSKV